jgi:hypothetical protein
MEDGMMRNIIITSAAIAALLGMSVVGSALADPKGEATITYLGNSNNIAEDGQGGNGTSEETVTGPKGRVENKNDPDLDCNNCSDPVQTKSPGNSDH